MCTRNDKRLIMRVKRKFCWHNLSPQRVYQAGCDGVSAFNANPTCHQHAINICFSANSACSAKRLHGVAYEWVRFRALCLIPSILQVRKLIRRQPIWELLKLEVNKFNLFPVIDACFLSFSLFCIKWIFYFSVFDTLGFRKLASRRFTRARAALPLLTLQFSLL